MMLRCSQLSTAIVHTIVRAISAIYIFRTVGSVYLKYLKIGMD